MNKFTQLYNSIHMPPELEQQICQSVPQRGSRFRPAAAVASLAMMVFLLVCSPMICSAARNLITIAFPDLGLTIWESPMDGGGKGQILHIDTDIPAFAHSENGRLYFTGNGEHLDITEQVTQTQPFFYTYQDQGYEITLAVGFEGSIENFGTYTLWKEQGQFVFDHGRNILSATEDGQPSPWVQIVWDTLDVPQDMRKNALSSGT